LEKQELVATRRFFTARSAGPVPGGGEHADDRNEEGKSNDHWSGSGRGRNRGGAERILAAVEADRLYALTHGDFENHVRHRAEGILAALASQSGRAPAPSWCASEPSVRSSSDQAADEATR
jgi:hypothetical protein